MLEANRSRARMAKAWETPAKSGKTSRRAAAVAASVAILSFAEMDVEGGESSSAQGGGSGSGGGKRRGSGGGGGVTPGERRVAPGRRTRGRGGENGVFVGQIICYR